MIKKILLILTAGLVSFALAFGVTFFLQKNKNTKQANQPAQKENQQVIPQNQNDLTKPSLANAGDEINRQKLQNLIYNIREKIKEYDQKLESLNLRKQRLKTTQDTIKKDITQLNELKLQLNNTLAQIKQQQKLLEQSKVAISDKQKRNLMAIAATYDKMDSASAGKILKNMTQINGKTNENGFNDAVKIFHYMSDRTKAKVLATLSDSEPELCAVFCQKLKNIVENR